MNVFACSKNSGRDHGCSGSDAHIAEDRKCAQGKRVVAEFLPVVRLSPQEKSIMMAANATKVAPRKNPTSVIARANAPAAAPSRLDIVKVRMPAARVPGSISRVANRALVR